MSATQIVVLVLAILVPVLVVLALLFIVLRGKAKRSRASLVAELANEPAVRGPESAVYRGSTGDYPHVLGNGRIVMTQRRILFRKTVGRGIDVLLADVSGVSVEKVFNRSVVGGQVHLVVHSHRGDVAYFVTDTDAWVQAITAQIG